MSEHRWTIPCSLDPDEAEDALRGPIEELEREGFEAIAHIETVGFFGWTLRADEERAVGVSIPQPGGPDQLLIRSEHEELGQQVTDQLTSTGPLEGHDADKKDPDVEPLRGP